MLFNTPFFVIIGSLIITTSSLFALSSFSIKGKNAPSSPTIEMNLKPYNIKEHKEKLRNNYTQLDIIAPWGVEQKIKNTKKIKKDIPTKKKWKFVGVVNEGNTKYALIYYDKVKRYKVGDVFINTQHLVAIGESHIVFTIQGKEVKKYLYQ